LNTLERLEGIIRINKDVHFAHTDIVPIEAGLGSDPRFEGILEPTNRVIRALRSLVEIELKCDLIYQVAKCPRDSLGRW
jgi:hypothetical protein